MAELTKPTQYNIEDSNIALLGSDIEKRVREHAGDKEKAWDGAGTAVGLKIWRIEKFSVVDWPKDRYGFFYDGDSYIVLNTYKKQKDQEELSYDIHFWLGSQTSQDEAGTAAYKTVELDDHLDGKAVQYREVQEYESPRFLSHFTRFVCLHGGVASGFHHVSQPPPDKYKRLFEIHLARGMHSAHLVVHEVIPEAWCLHAGDVYVLDLGEKVWQFNTAKSVGKEKFKAAEFVRYIADERRSQGHHKCEVTVYDEGGPGAGIFTTELGHEGAFRSNPAPAATGERKRSLLRLTDAGGSPMFEPVQPPFSRSSLSSTDAFILDDAHDSIHPAIYVWIGGEASLSERRLVLHYAQRYLHQRRETEGDGAPTVAISIVKMNEGTETEDFLRAMDT